MLFSPGATELTWAEFTGRVRSFARYLRAQGVELGDRVAVLDGNSIDYVTAHYAAVAAGAVLVPVNKWLRVPEVATVLKSARPRLLLRAAATWAWSGPPWRQPARTSGS